VYSELEEGCYNYKQVGASVYKFLITRKRKLQAFIVSLADIYKALAKKKVTDSKTYLPD